MHRQEITLDLHLDKARIYFLNNNVPEYSVGNVHVKVGNTQILKISYTPKLEHNFCESFKWKKR